MTERHVLSFPFDGRRFNYRVAGVIIVDGHVLVCTEDQDDYCMLPGGRVELGEPSRLSLEREIAEELAMPGTVGRMVATSESFYGREGEDFHELGFFYEATLPEEARPNGQAPWLRRWDEGHDLQFHWVALEGDGLERMNLLPGWLPEFLRAIPETLTHVVTDTRGTTAE